MRYVLGALAFAAVLLLGAFAFGIRPTFAEVALVVVAGIVSDVVLEAFK